MKRLLAYLFIVFGLGLTFSVNAEAKEKVKIGNPGWTGATAIANLLAAVVNDKIGGEAEIVPGNNTAIYGAIDRSKGEIEVHPDIWLPNQQAYTNSLVQKGTLKLSSNSYEGNQGYCVSQQFAKKFNITAIKDLKRPEVVKAMDSNNNGKGEFWIGADGWASANVNQVKLRDYGLYDAGIEPIRAAEAVKNARVLDSIKKGEGYAFYCYKPHAIWGMANVIMLKEPKFNQVKYKMVQPKESPNWYKKSYVASKDALKQIQIGWGTSLEKKSPVIVEFFKNFQLTADNVSLMSYQISVEKKLPANVARTWINNNQTIVESWLVPKNKINTQIAKAEPTEKPKKKVKVAKVEEPKQEEFKPKKTNQDNEAPVITIAEAITVNDSSYEFQGKVTDKAKTIYVEVDGRLVDVNKKGQFVVKGYSPIDKEISITAFDQWDNRSEPKIVKLTIDIKDTNVAEKLEPLNPSKIRSKSSNNKIALIIGIENYSEAPKANYANLDAKYFFDYARKAFGVKKQNINLLVNEEATVVKTDKALSLWLKSKIKKDKSELIIFFAGHGLASTDGKELYLLPQDGNPDRLERTAISRTDLFKEIISLSPKSVTMFLDTCYSGVSRDEQMLLASARPIRIAADEQEGIPDNFTIFSASRLDQISSGLKEANHGIFSYYLMKGMEGNADKNKDNDITNGELLAYMDENVSQKAAEQGRQQNPSLAGDPDKILMSYR
jgi:glycine betaine/proline transport system substrate-binding protein